MKISDYLTGLLIRSLATALGIDPVEYLVNQCLEDGISQDKLNSMLDRLGIS